MRQILFLGAVRTGDITGELITTWKTNVSLGGNITGTVTAIHVRSFIEKLK
jgi:hypothetical protein